MHPTCSDFTLGESVALFHSPFSPLLLPLRLVKWGGSGGSLSPWSLGVKTGKVHRCSTALFGRSFMSRGVSSVGYSVHWKLCCDVCSSSLQQGHRDVLLAPIRCRKLLRPKQKPDRSCTRVLRYSLLNSTSSSSTSMVLCQGFCWAPSRWLLPLLL